MDKIVLDSFTDNKNENKEHQLKKGRQEVLTNIHWERTLVVQ
jgi:hypothetical protein